MDLQQEILDPRVLEDYIAFEDGEPYEVAKLLETQSDLSSTPYFSRVEARPLHDQADSLRVPIEVELEPRKTQRFDVGVGSRHLHRCRGSFDVELRRLNKRGHRAEANVKLS